MGINSSFQLIFFSSFFSPLESRCSKLLVYTRPSIHCLVKITRQWKSTLKDRRRRTSLMSDLVDLRNLARIIINQQIAHDYDYFYF